MTDELPPTILPTGVTQELGMPAPQPAVPPMSVAEATSRKAEFFADQKKIDALMAGDVDATAEWKRITEGLSAQPAMPTGPREAATEHLDSIAGYNLSTEVLEEFRQNLPVTPAERRFAEAKFAECKQSPEWYAKYSRGDMQARREMALIVSILSRPVRDPQPQT